MRHNRSIRLFPCLHFLLCFCSFILSRVNIVTRTHSFQRPRLGVFVWDSSFGIFKRLIRLQTHYSQNFDSVRYGWLIYGSISFISTIRSSNFYASSLEHSFFLDYAVSFSMEIIFSMVLLVGCFIKIQIYVAAIFLFTIPPVLVICFRLLLYCIHFFCKY